MLPEYSVRQLAVQPFEGGEPAHDIVQRAPSEVWAVPIEPISRQKVIRWTHYMKDTHVMIPLLPYLVSPDPALAMAFMLQLGLRAGLDLGRQVHRIHLSIGRPVNQMQDPQQGLMWQVQVGIGLVIK